MSNIGNIEQEAGALSHLSGELGTWQKIATAPRDGTTFLARYGQDGVSIARFNENSPDYPLEYIDFCDDGSLVVNHSKVGEYCIASHWMPLPQ